MNIVFAGFDRKSGLQTLVYCIPPNPLIYVPLVGGGKIELNLVLELYLVPIPPHSRQIYSESNYPHIIAKEKVK